jgi:hypothetical protein
LANALISHSKALQDLVNNVLDNVDQIKEKKMAVLHRYYDLFTDIIKQLNNTAKADDSDASLKDGSNKLVRN